MSGEAGDTSATVGALCAALAKAQAAFPPIERSRTVSTGTYSFNYAPLDVIIAAVRPALAANGLAFSQVLGGGGGAPLTVRTLLLHSSGEWLASVLAFPMPAQAQQLGSAVTYLRRYALVSLLGVASEEDDDGNAADGKPASHKDRKRADLGRATAPPPAAPLTLAGALAGLSGVTSGPHLVGHYAKHRAEWAKLTADEQAQVRERLTEVCAALHVTPAWVREQADKKAGGATLNREPGSDG